MRISTPLVLLTLALSALPMTAAEKADHCKDGAAVVTATPKKATATSSKSLPSTAHVLSGPS